MTKATIWFQNCRAGWFNKHVKFYIVTFCFIMIPYLSDNPFIHNICKWRWLLLIYLHLFTEMISLEVPTIVQILIHTTCTFACRTLYFGLLSFVHDVTTYCTIGHFLFYVLTNKYIIYIINIWGLYLKIMHTATTGHTTEISISRLDIAPFCTAWKIF